MLPSKMASWCDDTSGATAQIELAVGQLLARESHPTKLRPSGRKRIAFIGRHEDVGREPDRWLASDKPRWTEPPRTTVTIGD